MKQIEDPKVLAQLADKITIKEITMLGNKECDVKYKLKPEFFDLIEKKKFKEIFKDKDLDSIVKTVILKLCDQVA